MRAIFTFLVLLAILGACSASGPNGPIPFHAVGDATGPAEGLYGTLRRPAGPGPFAVVIVLHGCGGLGAHQTVWAKRLNDWGYASFVLDSFGPRGVRNVCAPKDQPKVRPKDRASDVISAALWLRQQPGIDPERIAVLGNSHGGSTAAWATQAVYEQQYPGLLKAAVDYYGPCREAQTHGSVPLLALAGEADDWGRPAVSCKAFAARMRPDQIVEVHTYPGAVHAFDNPAQQAIARIEGHYLLYDPAAAEDSFRVVRAFLARWIGGGPPGEPVRQ